MDLKGKVAVITAGANGIGEGAALALAALGSDVVIGDIDAENGERVAAASRALGRRAAFHPADMMQADQARALVRFAYAEMGRVDILVNNAGGVRPRAFIDQTDGNWRRVTDLNFTSMLAATQEAAKLLEDGGAIVNIASTEALRAAPGFSVYAACKAAMVEFTKTMALELAHRNIRVNCIAPDLIDTPGLRPHMPTDPVGIDKRNRNVPLGRMASIHEAGSVIAFLSSPAASWVTGVTIPVDGGITAAAGWHRSTTGNWNLAS
ncbi:MAG: glucose 1-dehydrogenase [Sphingomonadales bacterium]|nr:MAG: glucose 1-dehydrogenase [Sphingomonadales bacterium]